ncbi:MAG: chlorite dismutase family protein [Planctomycetes bacterium]|nr:chlorite dismutase family protein [Planctomycetota bacterium]
MTEPRSGARAKAGTQDATETAAPPTYVDFLCFRVDRAFRQLTRPERAEAVLEFVRYVKEPGVPVEVRPYTALGFRSDCDFFLWLIAKDLESFQGFMTGLLRTSLGRYLESTYTWPGVTKTSVYSRSHKQHFELGPSKSRYLFIYPFTKTHAWYQLPLERRREMMAVHNEIGHHFPDVLINTCYQFGLGDHDFMLAFECDDPKDFSDLVQRLRETEARVYTTTDIPLMPGIRQTIEELVASLALA